jgi:anti-sigma factor RsiW
MVAGTHPDEIDLFDYVEDDLPQARRAEIAAHLTTCSVCAEQIRRVEAGRDSLAETQFLHLPKRRREAMLESLPDRGRAPGESRAFSPKAALAMVTALIAVAAVIGALVNSNSNSGLESSAGGTGAASDASGGKTESAQAQGARLFAGGTATDVASELRTKGFRAKVQQDRVVVRGATEEQVREALADRGPGDVEVVVKNP